MIAIRGDTRVAGVVGAPISRSLSPLLHNAWIAAAGLNAVYVAFPVEPARFAAFVEGMRGGAILGLNVTAPFKTDALCLADEAAGEAVRCGSANLLRFEPAGGVCADSTDGQGLLAAIRDQAPSCILAAGPTVILGTGGAARAAAAAVLDGGAPAVRLLGRSPEAAFRTAAGLGAAVIGGSLSDAETLVRGAALLVNATAAGAIDGRFAAAITAGLGSEAVVMDMIYHPLATPLLQVAASRGLATVDGLAMLIGQAAPSFNLFFGQAPPLLDVRALALAEISQGGRS